MIILPIVDRADDATCCSPEHAISPYLPNKDGTCRQMELSQDSETHETA